MFLSFGIYLFFPLVFYITSYDIFCKKKYDFYTRNVIFFILIIVYSIIIGTRYEVGTDWNNYKDYFFNCDFYFTREPREPVFYFLNKIVSYVFGTNYILFFSLIAFLQISLVLKALRRFDNLFPLAILLFFLIGPFLAFQNVMRQSLAFCLFFYAIKYIEQGSLKKYTIAVLIATGIHTSSILFLPLYFICRRKKIILDNLYVQLTIYFVSILLSDFIFSAIMPLVFDTFTSEQIIRYKQGYEDRDLTTGLGFIILKLLDLILLIVSSKMSKIFATRNYIIYNRIFFIGVIITNIASTNDLILRLGFPFLMVKFLLYAFVLFYLFSSKRKLYVVLAYLLITIFFALYSVSIIGNANGCSPYYFIEL